MKRTFRGLVFLFLACGIPATSGASEKPHPIWIDTDLSIGSPFREVDDGYALVLAFRSPELRVIGLSSSYGNGSLAASTRRTRDLVRRLGSAVMVNPGAASPNDIGRPSAASESLLAALRSQKKVSYLALGPLTNLAAFLQLHPRAAAGIGQIIMIAGKSPEATLGFGPGERFRIHDANFVKDPVAVRVVLAARIPLVIVPIETASRLTINAKDLGRLEKAGGPARFIARKSQLWLWFWRQIAQAEGGPIFDPLAVVAAARPDLLTFEPRSASLTTKGELIVRHETGEAGRKVQFATAFAPATKEFVLDRLCRTRNLPAQNPPR